MNTIVETLRVVLIQITDDALLLPNAAVAEVSGLDRFKLAQDGPEWLLGWHAAAERRVPVISFEALCGRPRPEPGKRVRIVIVNPIGPRAQVGGYALLAQTHPHLLVLDHATIEAVALRPSDDDDLVLSRVGVQGQEALIPDMEQIETRLTRLT